jgi:hypothetical protein
VSASAAPPPHRPSGRECRTLTAFLAMLVAREPGGLLEVRARLAEGGMAQHFYPSRRLRHAAHELLERGAETDVYVGCAPRTRPAGDRTALGKLWVLWVDCDDPTSVARLAAFAPAPAVIVRSGSGPNVHAYWPLLRPAQAARAAAANRRLAHALGACHSAVTNPAAILRPPGTLNFKHDPPTRVTLARFRPARRYTFSEVVGALPDPAPALADAPSPGPTRQGAGDDPLLSIAPAVYVQALTGQHVGRQRKIACPFHDDHTPSLHVYEHPEQGWYCFGCKRGGSIYDLAAALYRLPPRGRDFLELRERLHQRFDVSTPTGYA